MTTMFNDNHVRWLPNIEAEDMGAWRVYQAQNASGSGADPQPQKGNSSEEL